MKNKKDLSIEIRGEDRILKAEYGENLLDVLRKNRIFIESPCNGKGTCRKCRVEVTDSENRKNEILACEKTLEDDMILDIRVSDEEGRVLTSGYMPDFEFDNRKDGYAIAVDIGTTTIAMTLVDMRDGKEIISSTGLNPQKAYGLDVLSRISYETEKGNQGREDLKNILVEKINEMTDDILKEKTDISKSEITEMTRLFKILCIETS